MSGAREPTEEGAMDQGAVFDPQATQAMAQAYDKTCKALGVGDLADPDISKTIAYRIVDLAKRGERDPDQLCALTMRALIGEAKLPT
jgi:hypothetical protein